MTKLKTQSLHKRESELAKANKQVEYLSNGIFADGELPTFAKKIKEQLKDFESDDPNIR